MQSADTVGFTKFKSSHSKAQIFLFFLLSAFVSLSLAMQPYTLIKRCEVPGMKFLPQQIQVADGVCDLFLDTSPKETSSKHDMSYTQLLSPFAWEPSALPDPPSPFTKLKGQTYVWI